MSSKRPICRLCLSTPSVYFSLLEKDIPMMLEKLAAITVNEMEEETTISCIKCFLNLKLAYNIQQNILRADECIRNKDFHVPYTLVKEEVSEEILVIPDERLTDISSPEPASEPETTSELEDEDSNFNKAGVANQRKLLTDNGHFECVPSDKTFTSKSNFEAHSHGRKQCPLCLAWVATINYSKHHLYNHNPGPKTCELCGTILKNIQSLRRHQSIVHSDPSYCCEYCGKTFKERSSYGIHMKKHIGKKDYVCETCGNAFYTRYQMNKHIRGLHMKLRPFVCKSCKKGFTNQGNLIAHERQHTNEMPYKCFVCGQGFRHNVSLKAHKKSKHNIHEDLTTPCPLCSRMFGSKDALNTHMRVHKR